MCYCPPTTSGSTAKSIEQRGKAHHGPGRSTGGRRGRGRQGRRGSFATAAGSSFASAAGSSFASPSAAGSSFASPSAAGSSLATRRRRGLLLCDTAPARARAPPLRHGDGAEEWIDLSREEGGGRGWQLNLNRRLRVAHGKGMRYG
jgi:hypothetical protein